MKHRKSLSLIIAFVLICSLAVPAHVLADPIGYNADPTVMDIGPKLRAETLADVLAEGRLVVSAGAVSGDDGESAAGAARLTAADVGTVKNWVTFNDFTSQYTFTEFTLRAVGTYGEVWVANDLRFPAGDPRNSAVTITDEQIAYLLNEFDTNIYPKEVAFFAPPRDRKGEHSPGGMYLDESGRTVILITNIIDQAYYNPNYPSYIAGYFSPTISDFSDRNVMTIDAFDWLNRTGPNAARPYLYEGVFAHEFQHLLHHDTDAAEDTFMNEGLADLAQYIVGYGHSTGHVDFFMNNLRNSLTLWGDQSDLQILGDYGVAYLFQLYLYEQFGEEFIRGLFRNTLTGIASVNDALAKAGINKSFSELYADFMTAVLLDGAYQGDSSTFRFQTIDLSPNLDNANLADNSTPAWGTDFKIITPDKKIEHLYFQGIDFLGTNWTTAQDPDRGAVLWGNQGDLADNFLIKELDLTGMASPVLSFDTLYNIEEQWDYGFVQISEDRGATWTSLSNANTRRDLDPNAHPKVVGNVPGFTGSSGGWTTETFDLSAYAGKKVLLAFRYVTDWGYTESGWYLSNLRLNGELIDPMTDTSGFVSLEEAIGQYVDYQVQFIGFKKGKSKGNNSHVKILRLPSLINMSEAERFELGDLLRSSQFERIVMMTTFAAPEGTNNSVTYDYEVVMKETGKKKK